jgi:hypothetical protein
MFEPILESAGLHVIDEEERTRAELDIHTVFRFAIAPIVIVPVCGRGNVNDG